MPVGSAGRWKSAEVWNVQHSIVTGEDAEAQCPNVIVLGLAGAEFRHSLVGRWFSGDGLDAGKGKVKPPEQTG